MCELTITRKSKPCFFKLSLSCTYFVNKSLLWTFARFNYCHGLSRQLSSICLEKLVIIWVISIVQKVENFPGYVYFFMFLKCRGESWLLGSSILLKHLSFISLGTDFWYISNQNLESLVLEEPLALCNSSAAF